MGIAVKNLEETHQRYLQLQGKYLWTKLKEHNGFGELAVKVYEFTPLMEGFAIESMLRFPSSLQLTRAAKGYRGNLSLEPTGTLSGFHLASLNAIFRAGETEIASQEFHPKDPAKTLEWTLFLPREKAGEELSLHLSFKVDWREALYGVHQLHVQGSELQGGRGLNRVIHVGLERNTKVWGLIVLGDGLLDITPNPWGRDQRHARTFWKAMSVVLLVLIF